MDESALKTLLDSLEFSRSSLHGWLHFWTFLVVVGVALEVVFVVWEYADELHDFRRGIVHPPEKPSVLLLVLGLLGAGLVAVGVAGELYIDVHAGKVETEIRKANELRVSLLSKEAGDAKTSATGAADAAQRANDESDKAATAASKALGLLANALHRVAEAQSALDKLRSPRRLTPEQQKRIAAKLKSSPGMQFDLALTNLPEPAEFSLTLENTLGMGGWTEIDWKGDDLVSTRTSGRTTGFVTATGVVVQMHKEQVAKFWGAATALAEALKAEGIDARAEPGVGPKNDNNNAIHILVGEKPKK